MNEAILAYAAVIAAYAVSAWLAWRELYPRPAEARGGATTATIAGTPMLQAITVPVALAAHALLLQRSILPPGEINLGFGNALALVAWLATLIAWVTSLARPQAGLLAMLLPAAAVCAAVPLVLPAPHGIGGAEKPIAALHVAIALIGYAMFVVAVLQAVVLLSLEKRLHHGALGSLPAGTPPLLTLERLVFQLTAGAFVMLTLTLASGIVFTEALFDKPLRFNHKTVFSILAWFVFAALLYGRYRWGWRGRTALRWLLAGSAMLLLAYLGSKFVLEVLLGR
jgi:ABC-type uncharacterized transport system permease subunit